MLHYTTVEATCEKGSKTKFEDGYASLVQQESAILFEYIFSWQLQLQRSLFRDGCSLDFSAENLRKINSLLNVNQTV